MMFPFSSSGRAIRRFFGLGLLLSAGSALAESTPQEQLLAVVTCEYFDSRGLSLRTSSGLLTEGGLLLPYSALVDVTTIEAHSRSGDSWTADHLVGLHPEADLALLELGELPTFALTQPVDLAVPKDQEIRLVRGPGGPGPDTRDGTVLGKFSIGGPDYLAVSSGHEDGAAAFGPDGVLIGVCFDLSDQGYTLAYLAPAAAIANLLASVGPGVPIRSITPPEPPPYKTYSEAVGLTFRSAILQTAGSATEARTFIELALKKDPALPAAHFWMGRILFTEQRFVPAAASFRRAGELSESYPLAWHMAGAAHNQAGDYAAARQMYERALVVDPVSAATWCNLGGAEFNRQNWKEAEAAFGKAIELDPSYGLAHFNLGILLERSGRKEEAERTYEQLLVEDPSWAKRLRDAIDGSR